MSYGVTKLEFSGQSRGGNGKVEMARANTSLLSQEDRAMVGFAARFEE